MGIGYRHLVGGLKHMATICRLQRVSFSEAIYWEWRNLIFILTVLASFCFGVRPPHQDLSAV
jgi:hypothetical protein